jgi:hypothetical protein
MSEPAGLLPSIQWPPIITDVTLPRYVVWRDRLLTIAAWTLLLALTSDLFYLVVDHALELFGHPLTGPGAQWALWWDRLRPFVQVIALMAVWLTLWGLVSLRRLRRYQRIQLPTPLTLAEQAAHAGCTEADLLTWRGLRIAVVDLDAAGRPSVVPRQ